jgi:predicted TIM-barrel fold metal-dependent hydrolase
MHRLYLANITILIIGQFVVSQPPPPQSPRSIAPARALYDHHIHVLSPHLVSDWKSLGVPFSRPDSFYSSASSLFEEGKLSRGMVLSMAYLYGCRQFGRLKLSIESERERVRRENDFVASVVRGSPDRLAGFVSVNPLRPYALAEIRRGLADLKMKGIKLHFLNSGVDLVNKTHLERLKEVFALAQDLGVPLLIHLNAVDEGSGVKGVEILLRELIAGYPKTEIYIAHLGGYGGYSTQTEEVLNAFIHHLSQDAALKDRQILFDLSAVVLKEASEGVQPPDEERLKRLASDLRRLGLHRVLFGSDHPVFDPQEYARTLLGKLRLKEDEVQQILSNEAPVLNRLR